MGLQYKIDVIKSLKDKGYNPLKIRKEHLLAESTMTKLRKGIGVSWDNLETLCILLKCDISDIVEYVPDPLPLCYSSSGSENTDSV